MALTTGTGGGEVPEPELKEPPEPETQTSPSLEEQIKDIREIETKPPTTPEDKKKKQQKRKTRKQPSAPSLREQVEDIKQVGRGATVEEVTEDTSVQPRAPEPETEPKTDYEKLEETGYRGVSPSQYRKGYRPEILRKQQERETKIPETPDWVKESNRVTEKEWKKFQKGEMGKKEYAEWRQKTEGGAPKGWQDYQLYKTLRKEGLGGFESYERASELVRAGFISELSRKDWKAARLAKTSDKVVRTEKGYTPTYYGKWTPEVKEAFDISKEEWEQGKALQKMKETEPEKFKEVEEGLSPQKQKFLKFMEGGAPVPLYKREKIAPTYEGKWSPSIGTLFDISLSEWQKGRALKELEERGVAEPFEKGDELKYRLTKTPSEMSIEEERIAEEAGIEMPSKGPSRRLYEWGERTFEEGSLGSEITEYGAGIIGSALEPPRNILRLVPGEQPGEGQQVFTWRTGPDVEPMTERQEKGLTLGGLGAEFGTSYLLGKGIGEAIGTGFGFASEATGFTQRAQSVIQSGYSVFQTGKTVAPTATRALGMIASKPAVGAITTGLLGGYQVHQVGKMREPKRPKYIEKEKWEEMSEEEKEERGIRASWEQVGSYLSQTGGTMLGFATGFPSGIERGVSWGQKFRLGGGPTIPEEEFVPRYVRSSETRGQFPSFRGESAMRGQYIRPSAQTYTQLARKYSPQVLRILPEEEAITPSWSGQVAQKFGTNVLGQRSGFTFRPSNLWTKPSFTGGPTGRFMTPLGRHGTGMHFSFAGSKHFLRLGGETSYMPGITNPFQSPRWIYTELAIPDEVAASKVSPQFQQYMQQVGPGRYRFAMPMQSQWGEAQAILSPNTTMVEVGGPQFWASHGGTEVPIMRFLPKEIAQQASNVTAVSGTETTLGSLSTSQIGPGIGRTYIPLAPTPSVETPTTIRDYPSVTSTVFSESILEEMERIEPIRVRPSEPPSTISGRSGISASLIGGYSQPSYGQSSYGESSYKPVSYKAYSYEPLGESSYGVGGTAPTLFARYEPATRPETSILPFKFRQKEKREYKKPEIEQAGIYRERFFPIESPITSTLLEKIGEKEAGIFRQATKKKSKKKKPKKKQLSISELLSSSEQTSEIFEGESLTEALLGEKKKTKQKKQKESKNGSIFGGNSLTEELL